MACTMKTIIVGKNGTKELPCSSLFLLAATASTGLAGRPELPGLASPVVDLDSTSKIGGRITRSFTTRARSPVHLIDLPETSIDAAVVVLVTGVCITTRFMLNNALAA